MNIRKATESALVAYLEDYVTCNIYEAFRGDNVDHPCVIVSCSVGQEMPLESGNFEVSTDLIVQGSIDEAIPNASDQIDSIVDGVNDAIRNVDLPSEASAKLENFTVLGVMSKEGPTTEFDNDENIVTSIFKISTLNANIDI